MLQNPQQQNPHLFSPLTIRSVTLRNRIMVSPMCQYSSENGFVNDWHLVHLGAFATGGAAIVMTEATAVEARGRISPADIGIWQDDFIPGLQQITRFISDHGALPAIQLAHAGRKAGTAVPWIGGKTISAADGGWPDAIIAPSALAFNDGFATPNAMTLEDCAEVVQAFTQAAQRAVAAGFAVIEIHAAHGYLLHQFLSSAANHRSDAFGGDLHGRAKLLLDITAAVRHTIGEAIPIFVRISATDWLPPGEGFDIEEAVKVSGMLRKVGADAIDVSSGGLSPRQQIQDGPGYQVPFAAKIRSQAEIPVAAVGRITDPEQANEIITTGQADIVAMARELLRNPHWPLLAAHELGQDSAVWPKQYLRAQITRKI